MRRATLSIAVSAAFLALACATSQPKEVPTTSPQTPLPRSSIAAVLQHKDELQLTDDQVRRLQELDDQLEQQNAALRQAAEKRKSKDPSSSGGFGKGIGGGSRGAMGGRLMRGPRSSASDGSGPKSLEERMDDNDTNAYLEAEKVLTEQQRARATEIASKFRQERWDRQHASPKPSDQ